MSTTPLPDLSRSRVVLVGTWDYTHLRPVKAVDHSFQRMHALLTSDLCGWPAERVTLLPNEKEPGKLPLQLIDLYGDAEDVALFYYVGHGQSDHNGRLCLGLTDSRPEAKFRASTSLEFEHVRAALYHSNARTKIAVLDCCFAGLAIEPTAALGGRDVADSARCDGTYTMAASAEYDLARYEEDGTPFPQTYFTKYLADIVEEGIGGRGDILTIQVIFDEISSRMRANRLSPPTQANRDNASRFPFSRNPAAVTATGLPPGVVEALSNPLPGVRGAVVSGLSGLADSADPNRAQAARRALRELAERDPDTEIRRHAGTVLDELASAASSPKPTRAGWPRSAHRVRLSRRPTVKRVAIALVAIVAVVSVSILTLNRKSGNPTTPGGSTVPDRRPTGSDQQQIDNMVKPPPLSPGFPPPVDKGVPDGEYRQFVQCVRSSGGSVPTAAPWAQNSLQLDNVSGYVTGANQTVAVIDTGVNPHDFLGDRLLPGGDYVQQSGRGLEDCDGHGTQVAGIIAAKPSVGSNEFSGIAPQAKVLSIRQSSANYVTEIRGPAARTERSAGTLATLAQAIVHAADKNVSVIAISVTNCHPVSLGPIGVGEQQVQAALRYAVETKNVVVVVPAGEFGPGGCPSQNEDPSHPTMIPVPAWFSDHVISVAGVKQNGSPIESSLHGPWISVVAPGTDIVTLDPGSSTGLANTTVSEDQKPGPIKGTSFASAYVAGLAALVREYRPQLSAKQVMNRIKATAAHPNTVGGWNDEVGYGMINPLAALTTAVPGE